MPARVTLGYTRMLRGRGLNKFSPTGTPRERHVDTETEWFQYVIKPRDFPLGRRPDFSGGFGIGAAASGSVRSGLPQADDRLELCRKWLSGRAGAVSPAPLPIAVRPERTTLVRVGSHHSKGRPKYVRTAKASR